MTHSTKTLDSTSLPTPPEIPVSNASYAKIIERIRQSASHGALAVGHVRDTISGTNTYAKMCRRYADACIGAIVGPDASEAQAKAVAHFTPKPKIGFVLKDAAQAKAAEKVGRNGKGRPATKIEETIDDAAEHWAAAGGTAAHPKVKAAIAKATKAKAPAKSKVASKGAAA